VKLTKGQEQLTSVSMRQIILQTIIIATYTGKRNAHKIMPAKPEGKRPVERDLCRNKCII
jgi:hypothetical protein